MGPGSLVIASTGHHAILTFALPEHADDLADALAGTRWRLVLWDLDRALRQVAKYSEGPEQKHASWARGQLHEALRDAGLSEEFDR